MYIVHIHRLMGIDAHTYAYANTRVHTLRSRVYMHIHVSHCTCAYVRIYTCVYVDVYVCACVCI